MKSNLEKELFLKLSKIFSENESSFGSNMSYINPCLTILQERVAFDAIVSSDSTLIDTLKKDLQKPFSTASELADVIYAAIEKKNQGQLHDTTLLKKKLTHSDALAMELEIKIEEVENTRKKDPLEEETENIIEATKLDKDYQHYTFMSPESYSRLLVRKSPYLSEKNIIEKGLILSKNAQSLPKNHVIGPYLKKDLTQGELKEEYHLKNIRELGLENLHYSMPAHPIQTLDDDDPNLVIAVPSLNALDAARDRSRRVCPTYFINHCNNALVRSSKNPENLSQEEIEDLLKGKDGYILWKKKVYPIADGEMHFFSGNVREEIVNVFPKTAGVIKTPYADDLKLLEERNTMNVPLPRSHNVEFCHVEYPKGSGKYEVIFFTVKPIEPGEEMLTTYGEYFQNNKGLFTKNLPLIFHLEEWIRIASKFSVFINLEEDIKEEFDDSMVLEEGIMEKRHDSMVLEEDIKGNFKDKRLLEADTKQVFNDVMVIEGEKHSVLDETFNAEVSTEELIENLKEFYKKNKINLKINQIKHFYTEKMNQLRKKIIYHFLGNEKKVAQEFGWDSKALSRYKPYHLKKNAIAHENITISNPQGSANDLITQFKAFFKKEKINKSRQVAYFFQKDLKEFREKIILHLRENNVTLEKIFSWSSVDIYRHKDNYSNSHLNNDESISEAYEVSEIIKKFKNHFKDNKMITSAEQIRFFYHEYCRKECEKILIHFNNSSTKISKAFGWKETNHSYIKPDSLKIADKRPKSYYFNKKLINECKKYFKEKEMSEQSQREYFKLEENRETYKKIKRHFQYDKIQIANAFKWVIEPVDAKQNTVEPAIVKKVKKENSALAFHGFHAEKKHSVQKEESENLSDEIFLRLG